MKLLKKNCIDFLKLIEKVMRRLKTFCVAAFSISSICQGLTNDLLSSESENRDRDKFSTIFVK